MPDAKRRELEQQRLTLLLTMLRQLSEVEGERELVVIPRASQKTDEVRRGGTLRAKKTRVSRILCSRLERRRRLTDGSPHKSIPTTALPLCFSSPASSTHSSKSSSPILTSTDTINRHFPSPFPSLAFHSSTTHRTVSRYDRRVRPVLWFARGVVRSSR